jgi:hypothetical protein
MHLLPSVHRLRDPVAAEAGRLLRLLFLRLGSLPANTSGATVLRLGKAGVNLKLIGMESVEERHRGLEASHAAQIGRLTS